MVRRQFAHAVTPGPEPWSSRTGGPSPSTCTFVAMPPTSMVEPSSGVVMRPLSWLRGAARWRVSIRDIDN